jgi:phosphoribosylaminoimidazolecarboxamide formyltransferase/IMP cyclohydrolase
MKSPKIERAIISVSNKDLLTDFAQGLVAAGVEIYASGGTLRHLEQAGVPVREIAAYTGFPEMMEGRLKTLHPKIHGGILCRRDHDDDMTSAAEHGILPFELVVVNLYPFEETVARPGVTVEEAIEKIDIGGPTLVRAAAKNHEFVTIACQPTQYERILQQVQSLGSTTPELRRELAGAAFAHTAAYDTAIAAYFAELARKAGHCANDEAQAVGAAEFPETLTVSLRREAMLRYGENPHQAAALYALPEAACGSLVSARNLHGKELSYNNLLDLDSALAAVRSIPSPGVVVLKHNNSCGAATADTLVEAMRRAWNGDPVSAFGSVLGFNVPVDAQSADFLAEPGRFVEAILAPEFAPEAFEILTTKPKWKNNVRLLAVGTLKPGSGSRQLRQVSGGMLCQTADDQPDDTSEWKVVTDAQPSAAALAELEFAWAVCRHVKSNAIVLCQDRALVGAGAGQMSRVDSVEIAIHKAGDRARGSVMASDAFFPFDDSIHLAAKVGVAAVIQPGGSRGDESVIAACNKYALPMIFTGRRHFRH